MNLTRQSKRHVVIAFGLAAAAALTFYLVPVPHDTTAAPPGDVMRLSGRLIDFRSDHSDFNLGATGHQPWNVSSILGDGGAPVFVGGGATVASQWYDTDGNPIMPYAGDLGLPGGHFDIDAYDEATRREVVHVHEFDDRYDVEYVDIANDSKLAFEDIIGESYPNDLRVSFHNAHHGSGVYVFEAGAGEQTGATKDGFEATFDPVQLTQLRVTFASLDDLRKTDPSTSQDDVEDRDDAFAVRMYDVTTDELVYELAVYHHYQGPVIIEPIEENDRCGNLISDTAGAFGAPGSGGVTDASSYGQWYSNELGVNQSTSQAILLTRNSAGVYEYLTDEFFPADDRLFGNEGDDHNNNFTYSISATFTYNLCTAQFFEFEGNDDAWVFINNEMAIDLGGMGTPERQYIALDRLDLVDGETYTLDFFFAHRRNVPDSVFRVRTNIWLETAGEISVSGSYD